MPNDANYFEIPFRMWVGLSRVPEATTDELVAAITEEIYAFFFFHGQEECGISHIRAERLAKRIVSLLESSDA